jgi:hypothetical protein
LLIFAASCAVTVRQTGTVHERPSYIVLRRLRCGKWQRATRLPFFFFFRPRPVTVRDKWTWRDVTWQWRDVTWRDAKCFLCSLGRTVGRRRARVNDCCICGWGITLLIFAARCYKPVRPDNVLRRLRCGKRQRVLVDRLWTWRVTLARVGYGAGQVNVDYVRRGIWLD